MNHADQTSEDRPNDNAKANPEPSIAGAPDLIPSVSEASRRRLESSRLILIDFLKAALPDHLWMRDFCFRYFPEVHSELKETDRHSQIIPILMNFCESNGGGIRALWDCLAIQNKEKHDEFFPRWAAAEQVERDEGETPFAEFVGNTQSRRVDSDPLAAEHPLSSQKPEAVSDWFFNELGSEDRGLVLATALFQGMSRSHLVRAGSDFAKLFDGAVDRSPDAEQSRS
jgi:hypothetical protein